LVETVQEHYHLLRGGALLAPFRQSNSLVILFDLDLDGSSALSLSPRSMIPRL